MRDLPKGWQQAKLGELVDVLDSQRVPINKTERAKRPGVVPYYGATGQVDTIDEALFDEELLLLGEDGVPFLDPGKPKAYQVSGPAWVNNHAHVLRAMEGVSSNRFLCHYLNVCDYHEFVNGTTRLKLTQGAMRELPVPVPPVAEQGRIVDAIEEHFSTLDNALNGVSSATLRLNHLHRSVFAQAQVEGADTTLGSLLFDIEAGKSFKTPGRQAQHGEWGVIKVSAMTWGEFQPNENKAVPSSQAIDERYQIRPGDLLLSRANTSEYVGASVLVRECPPRLLMSDKSMRLITNPGVDKRWLRFALGSPQVRDQMSQLASGTSDSMRNISQAKVRSLRIRLPDPGRQIQIAEAIDSALYVTKRLLGETTKASGRVGTLRSSILSRAFSGRLVSQDATDEPASLTLTRIQTGQVQSFDRKLRKRKATA